MDRFLLQALVDLAPDGIVLIDPGGRIAFVNGEARRMFGYPPEELVGRTIEHLVPERFRAKHVHHQSAYQEHPVVRPMGSGLELFGRRRDGSELPVEISLSSISTEEGNYVTAIVRDISERRALEAERQYLMAQTELQRDRERIAQDLHDGVMQAIYAVGLNLLQTRQLLGTSAPEAVEAIDEAVAELRQVIDDIRSYVMSLPLQRLETAVAPLLREVVEEACSGSTLSATLMIAEDLPQLSETLTVTLYHLAREALSNVRKHAAASNIELRLSAENDQVTLEVRDDGIGFETAAPQAKEHLGLRNMRTRAASLGGSVEFESAPGSGTTVRCSLPLERPESSLTGA